MLNEAIERVLEGLSLKELSEGTKRLSENYRGTKIRELIKSEHAAYLATRMPATAAVLCHVLEMVQSKKFRSLLDIGSGPGTTLFAAVKLFADLEKIYLVEKQRAFLDLAKELTKELPLFTCSDWIEADIEKKIPSIRADLVVASYSLGEIAQDKQLSIAEQLWDRTSEVLIFIEPGTPAGFERLRAVRTLLLSKGAYLLAPCPHSGSCPMAGGNWCHFSTRLARSSIHRRAKEGRLNYEDEKFSYLIFSRKRESLAEARILRHPHRGKGHVAFTLCTEEGLKERIVTKKEAESYRTAKKKEWGGSL
jgi:ribosomal protein RSM22 (predicted rRNA methylase)